MKDSNLEELIEKLEYAAQYYGECLYLDSGITVNKAENDLIKAENKVEKELKRLGLKA